MDNIEHAQIRQKQAYDSHHNVAKQDYNITKKCIVKNFTRKKGLGTVNMTKYKGPFIIADNNGKGNYKLKYPDSDTIFGNQNPRNFECIYHRNLLMKPKNVLITLHVFLIPIVTKK